MARRLIVIMDFMIFREIIGRRNYRSLPWELILSDLILRALIDFVWNRSLSLRVVGIFGSRCLVMIVLCDSRVFRLFVEGLEL